MAAVELDLVIEKGARMRRGFIYADSNEVAQSLAGYKGRMHIRQSVDDPTTLLELDDVGNARVELERDNTTGLIEIYLGATVTEAITWTTGFYDLEIYSTTDPDEVIRLLKGAVSVDEEVTR